MKTPVKAIVIFVSFGLSSIAHAAENKNTVSLGYANAHYKGLVSGDAPGFNIKYNWEHVDSGFGVIGSVTRTSSELVLPQSGSKGKISHLSALAGPSYRFNDRVSIYGLAGVAHDKAKIVGESGSVNSFAYGAGVRVSPIKNWSVDASYEQVRNSDGDKNSAPMKVGTWVLGVGYSF